MNNLMDNIVNRRSVRAYTDEPVTEEQVKQILTAGIWAPSGNNLQPWKFSVVMRDPSIIEKLSTLTIYGKWFKTAPCLIAVFLDKQYLDAKLTSVHLKHTQAIGSAIQNMLLTAQDMGLGTCWIGEILKNEEEVRSLLGASDDMQLMAVLTLGHPTNRKTTSKRRELSENIISWL